MEPDAITLSEEEKVELVILEAIARVIALSQRLPSDTLRLVPSLTKLIDAAVDVSRDIGWGDPP